MLPIWKMSAHKKHTGKGMYDDEEHRQYLRNPKYDCSGGIHPMFCNGQGSICPVPCWQKTLLDFRGFVRTAGKEKNWSGLNVPCDYTKYYCVEFYLIFLDVIRLAFANIS